DPEQGIKRQDTMDAPLSCQCRTIALASGGTNVVMMFAPEAVRMHLTEKRLLAGFIIAAFQQSELVRFDGPARLAQQFRGANRPGHDVQNLTIWSAEIAGDIAALLVTIDDPKSADFLKRRDKVSVHVGADLLVGQRVDTQRLSIVSGK